MPAPEVNLEDTVRNYLDNRRGFYETLFARLPAPVIRERMAAAVMPLIPDAELRAAVTTAREDTADGFLRAVKTLDLVKKSSSGSALGRTTISIDEALDRSFEVEKLGIILFAHLAESYQSLQTPCRLEMKRRKQALSMLLELYDELRYHKLSLIPPR